MYKLTQLLIIILAFTSLANAGEITYIEGLTITIYGTIEDTQHMSALDGAKTNFNKTVCSDAVVIEGEIGILGKNEYELEYTFIADINDSTYISRILVIKQEIKSSSLLGGTILNRTLTLDGCIIGQYETKTGWFSGTKKNTVYFDLIDNNIRFGADVVINESLAFTQLNYQDQQDYLYNVSRKSMIGVYHKYISVGNDDESSTKLSGLTGVFYNIFGDSVLTSIPIVGGAIASFGKSIQALIYLPLTIIQFAFNFIFTFISLLVNNWWYALLLLEIICILPALKYNRYPDIVGKYFKTHVQIFTFMYEYIFLNIINLILRLIEIIRNMFRI